MRLGGGSAPIEDPNLIDNDLTCMTVKKESLTAHT